MRREAGGPVLGRRALLRSALVLGASSALGTAGCAATTASRRAQPGPVLGLLQAEPEQYDALRDAGLTAVTISVPWGRSEPRPGQLDERYLGDVRRQWQRATSAGLDVVLSPGLQYPPDWVAELDDARLVDQDGVRWRGGPGERVSDAVFSAPVRQAQEDNLRRVADHLADLRPTAVRVGGLVRGELHYPPPGEDARQRFWAFGRAARASCPVPDFRPGQPDEQAATAFLQWYLDALALYGRHQAEVLREGYGPASRLLVLLPSWGVRPGEVEQAAAGGLDGSTPGERRGTLCEGVDWARQAEALDGLDGVDLCTTWLDARSQGSTPSALSPVRYLARVAERHERRVWGENTGENTASDLRRCLHRVEELGLAGMLWMRGPDLGRNGWASLEDYAEAIDRLEEPAMTAR